MALKKILLRRDTRTNWDLNNPYLEEGEIGVILEGTNSTIKIGAYKDTEKTELYRWNELPEIIRTDGYFKEYLKKEEATGAIILVGNSYQTTEYKGNIELESILPGVTIDSALSTVENNISDLADKVADNELVAAGALADLDLRVNQKQDTLVSGENIKTINGINLLESGNLEINAKSLGLSAALKYCGITTTELTDGSTTNPVMINGSSHSPEAGCVVFYEDKEFIFNGLSWEELGYPTDLSNYTTLNTAQTITGVKTFNEEINLSNKSIIESGRDIDAGEFKVRHNGSKKGFIIRTKNETSTVLPLEIMSTSGEGNTVDTHYYIYKFPKKSGTIPLAVKVNNITNTPGLNDGIIDLGSDFTKTVRINGNSSNVLTGGIIDLGYGFPKAKEVSYEELKNLRDNLQLIPGQIYRIIDYITTTSQEDTISAGKPFDILVTAISNKELNENVSICLPRGERALDGAYQIGYLKINESISPLTWDDIDNVTNSLTGAIADYQNENNISFGEYSVVGNGYTCTLTNGAVKLSIAQSGSTQNSHVLGIEVIDNTSNKIIDSDYTIYQLIPGNTNTAVYRFSNLENKEYFFRILFAKPTSSSGNVSLKVEIIDYSKPYLAGVDVSKWQAKYSLDNDITKYGWADTTNGKGVIYYLKDEWDNECYYDFKNIKFKRTKEWVNLRSALTTNNEVNFSTEETERFLYTFDYNGTDDSLNTGRYKCEHNSIGKCMSGKVIILNDTIFLGNGNSNNKLGENNKNNTFGFDTYNNIIGVNFQGNVLPCKFTYNIIGNGFQDNYYSGAYFRYNNIGHFFSNNLFNGYVSRCNILNEVKGNKFNGLLYNTCIGNTVQNNIFTDKVGCCNLGDYIMNVINFPSLFKVTIDTYILYDSGALIDLNYVTEINGISLYTGLNTAIDENTNSNESIHLCKNDSGEYVIIKNSRRQDRIDDLDDIRSGAQLGKTAVQPEILNNYTTHGDVQAAIKNAITDTLNTSV